MNVNYRSRCVATSKIPLCDGGYVIAQLGTGTLVGGTATIQATKLEPGSLVFLTNTTNPPSGPLSAHTFNFTVSPPTFNVSGTGADTFNWMIVNP